MSEFDLYQSWWHVSVNKDTHWSFGVNKSFPVCDCYSKLISWHFSLTEKKVRGWMTKHYNMSLHNSRNICINGVELRHLRTDCCEHGFYVRSLGTVIGTAGCTFTPGIGAWLDFQGNEEGLIFLTWPCGSASVTLAFHGGSVIMIYDSLQIILSEVACSILMSKKLFRPMNFVINQRRWPLCPALLFFLGQAGWRAHRWIWLYTLQGKWSTIPFLTDLQR